MDPNGLGDSFRPGQGLLVFEPDYGPAQSFQFDLPQMVVQNNVVAIMYAAVDFDDEAQSVAREIDDVGTDRVLAAKLAAIDPAAPQQGPDLFLGQTRLLAEGTSS